jgi:phosphate transport system substrate-binding protein
MYKPPQPNLSVRLLVGAALAAGSIGIACGAVRLTETGSSLLYPLFNLWVSAYTQKHSDVRINTIATGSGTGIAQAIQGIVAMGASEAYLSDALMKKYPQMLNIPVAISSQMINYRVPEAQGQHLKLSGPVLAGIYKGKIRYWDNKRIQSLNSGINLPHKPIVPIHRADGSGDTFMFTQFLSKTDADWRQKISYGTTVSWPKVAGAIGATGNSGVISAASHNPYSVAYVGISYKQQTAKKDLGEARIKNKAGNYVLPNPRTVTAAAAHRVSKTPKGERISLVYAPGAQSYPIINYEYVLVKAQQRDAQIAKELKSFLIWAVSKNGGNSRRYLAQVRLIPLPPKVRRLTLEQIHKISS